MPTTADRRAWGREGARRRWGEPRTVNLRTLDPATAGVIRAILAAREHAAAREEAATELEAVAASAEGQTNDHAAA